MERNRKNMLVISAASLVLGALMGLLSSCTKDDMVSDSKVQRTTEFIPSPTPTPEPTPTPTPVEWNVEKDSLNKGTSYNFSIIAKEKYSGARREVRGEARISLKDYEYFVEDRYRDLDVVFANNNRTFGAPVIVGNSYKRSASFAHEDGQVTTVPVEITNDTDYNVSVEDIRLTSVRNLAEADTRAQFVSDTLRTEICAEVFFAVNLNGSRYNYTQLLKDTCTRYLLSEDEIASKTVEKDNQLIDNTSEYFSVIKKYIMKSGEKRETSATIVTPITLETISFEPIFTESFDWKHIGSDPISEDGKEFEVKKEGPWKVYMQKNIYSSYAGYNQQTVEFLYTMGACRVEYNDGEDSFAWDYKEFGIVSDANHVDLLASDREGFDKADVVNTIEVAYFGSKQPAQEDVILYKEQPEPEPAPVPDPVIDGYWDETTLIDIITDNFRKVSITWITTTDGVITDSQVYEKEFPRTLVCQSDWSVEADDFNQNTTGLKAVLSKSTPSSDGAWSWDAEAYTIAENATGTGWTKSNSWASTEANGITVTRDGKTYYFSDKAVSVNSNATVDGSGNYTSRLSYTFGDNTKESKAPGKINQKAEPEEDPFFPKNWGKILGATQTVAPNETHEGYVYTLVFRFENGTLGVKMNGGESQINWDNFSHFTTDTDQSINGMSYLKGQDSWMFVSADDYADALTYVQTNGQMVDNIAYPKAKSLGWDEGHLVNNHASVHTSRYSMSIVDNVITISDTYTGVNYGSFDSAK